MNGKKQSEQIYALVKEMVFGSDGPARQKQIREMAAAAGIYPASIQVLYEEIGKGRYPGFTVPAINLRGITYDMARAAIRAGVKNKVGPLIFEIARSEMGYTLQSPGEFAAAVMGAALAEGYRGPLFLQGDHMQIRRKNFATDPVKETEFARSLIKECIEAGFYNIDIDASTLVEIEKPALLDQQLVNGKITAEMTSFIRSLEPRGVTISVGGEIGEIGAGNSTVEDLRAFMARYREFLPAGLKGISKISVQTGTTHGGIALPDGSMAKVMLDFNTLEQLSKLARSEFGMGGAVQHGASTLPDEMFDLFPKVGTLEVHLATGFQNIVFDSAQFPRPLLEKIHTGLKAKYPGERKAGDTDTQFYYSTRKRAFGDFKKEMWELPAEALQKIGQELEERFAMLYRKLNVVNTRGILDKVFKS
ncbi:MAG TPA: class II fructose-bisphosphate aldolase [Dehalococcoidales bacterium]|nr:class II fructose-bisphosphate aldolase [Dehalococcoidales bacterium]